MQVHLRWLHVIRKREDSNYRRKKLGVKNMKIRNCFCKYAIEDNHVA